jgi:hypothetical protein
MINRILHTVTNRATGFVSPVFPKFADFVPRIMTGEALALLKFLQLDREDTDFFVVGILQAVDAFPCIRESFGPEIRTYDLSMFSLPTPELVNCQLVDGPLGPPSLRRIPEEFPTQSVVQLSYRADDVMHAELGDRIFDFPVRAAGTCLHPEWPEALGIKGDLEWHAGFSAQINFWPTGFPYQALADALDAFAPKSALLSQSGLSSHYHLAFSAIEKVAITALALGLSNPVD